MTLSQAHSHARDYACESSSLCIHEPLVLHSLAENDCHGLSFAAASDIVVIVIVAAAILKSCFARSFACPICLTCHCLGPLFVDDAIVCFV